MTEQATGDDVTYIEACKAQLDDPNWRPNRAVWSDLCDSALAIATLSTNEAADKLEAMQAEIERLRETVVELWHDSNAGHGALHECLGLTWEEYGKWVNPDALNLNRERG